MTSATVGRESGDVSLVTGVAGGDENGSIAAVVPEGSTDGSFVASVPRRDGSVGPINKAKDHGFVEYNTVNEQAPINAGIEHFVNTISAFAVLLWISFFIIIYAIGANAIHSTVNKQMLATNREGLYLNLLQDFALCVAVPPSCMQTVIVIGIHLFVLNSKHGRSDVMV